MKQDYTLILYSGSGFKKNASTTDAHIESFMRYIDSRIISIDMTFIYSSEYLNVLQKKQFSHIFLHHSLFGVAPFSITSEYKEFIKQSNALKICFFQDEYASCPEKYEIINKLNMNIVFTLLEKKYHQEVYFDNTKCSHVYTNLTGYVDDNLIEKSKKYTKEFHKREIDVGYRARKAPVYLGLGGQEKSQIAETFIKYTKDTNLKSDISTSEKSRIYGEDWFKFLGNCKSCLGAEAGASIFDVKGEMVKKLKNYLNINPKASTEELNKNVFSNYENIINYRQISPRIFESAVFKNLMVLFEGEYSSVIEPNVHYLELKKDFSNINEILEKMSDIDTYNRITKQAYDDLILSGKYSYRKL